MGNSIKDTDKGFAKVVAEMKAAHENIVKVGIQGADAERAKQYFDSAGAKVGGPATLVEVATVHEFGSPSQSIPERSFLRQAVDANRKDLGTLSDRLVALIVGGKLAGRRALGLAGQQIEAHIDAQFEIGGSPAWEPLSQPRRNAKSATLPGRKAEANAKGAQFGAGGELEVRGDVPLNDTGQLKNSITSVVSRREKA